MSSIKPYELNSIFTNANRETIKSNLENGFLERRSVTMLFDSIQENTDVANIQIAQEGGSLVWKIGDNTVNLEKKASWVPFWMRKIAHWWRQGTPKYDREFNRKIQVVTDAFLEFQKNNRLGEIQKELTKIDYTITKLEQAVAPLRNQLKALEAIEKEKKGSWFNQFREAAESLIDKNTQGQLKSEEARKAAAIRTKLQPTDNKINALRNQRKALEDEKVLLKKKEDPKKEWGPELAPFFNAQDGENAAPVANLMLALLKDRIEAYAINGSSIELTLKPGKGEINSPLGDGPIEIPAKVTIIYKPDKQEWQLHGAVKITMFRELNFDQMVIKCEGNKRYLDLHDYPIGTGMLLGKFKQGNEGMSSQSFDNWVSNLKVFW